MSTPRRRLLFLALALSLGGILALSPLGPGSGPRDADEVDDGRGTPWIVRRCDNVCGVDEPRQITSPARVQWERALAATPQMRELVRRGIDPESPEGIVLRTAAAETQRDACTLVRLEHGYCSVWRRIRCRDGGEVPDVTAEAVAIVRALAS